MLGYLALIFILFLSIKLSVSLGRHKEVFLENGISFMKYTSLQISPLLYIVSLIGFALPFAWLNYFRPIPTGFFLLIPGIILGKQISSVMDRVGFNVAAQAGRAAYNIMWLGVGSAIFIVGNILIGLLLNSIGYDDPL